MVNTAHYEGMPNVFLEAWARGVPALALHHDPDGVIVREGIGAFAAGDPARFAEQASALWSARRDFADVAARCQRYVGREHGPESVAGAWAAALGLETPRP
jgi:glycosyltransferase involved in cell wall biosynthesis